MSLSTREIGLFPLFLVAGFVSTCFFSTIFDVLWYMIYGLKGIVLCKRPITAPNVLLTRTFFWKLDSASICKCGRYFHKYFNVVPICGFERWNKHEIQKGTLWLESTIWRYTQAKEHYCTHLKASYIPPSPSMKTWKSRRTRRKLCYQTLKAQRINIQPAKLLYA